MINLTREQIRAGTLALLAAMNRLGMPGTVPEWYERTIREILQAIDLGSTSRLPPGQSPPFVPRTKEQAGT